MKKENKEKKQRSPWRRPQRMLSVVLALVMVFQLLPVSALAEEGERPPWGKTLDERKMYCTKWRTCARRRRNTSR